MTWLFVTMYRGVDDDARALHALLSLFDSTVTTAAGGRCRHLANRPAGSSVLPGVGQRHLRGGERLDDFGRLAAITRKGADEQRDETRTARAR